MSETLSAPASEATATGGPSVGASQQFVTFWLNGEVFGIPLSEVQEIIRMPRVVRVPMAAASLEGIANLRGAVLPIISLRRIFGMTDVPHDDATRVVVVNRGSLLGYVIDRMASVITTDVRDIESIESIAETIRTDLLQGVIKRSDGTIMLLNLPRLADGEPAVRETRVKGPLIAATSPLQSKAAAVDGAVRQLVSFEVAGQEYAFPIGDVQEIVQVPPRISSVPRSDHHVMGVMTLRNRLLPLVSLRRMFDLEQAPLNEQNRIVVVSIGGADGPPLSVGIIMDAVNEVLRVAASVVEPVPPLLAAQKGGSELEAICRLDGGRLVTILSAEKMFPAGVRGRLLEAARSAGTEEEMEMTEDGGGLKSSDEEQFVVFRLGEEEFGVPIGTVQEIIRVPEHLTKVPKTPDFIGGVVNLRGVVLPVVDQRRRFGLPELPRSDRQRIVVLMVAGVRTGFVVDSVVEVLKVARGTIGPAPHLSDQQHLLIDRVANLEDQRRMLMLMRPERLLTVDEIGAVAGL
ncbi:chemotaxis protein CheW [Acidisoma sp.]|uniref:chemotaxis protein CheW n=1 Tax=Acidisoma sp. TaxID=1872115 RepID=UPI003B008FF6